MIENSNLKLEHSEGLKCEDGLNWYIYANNNPLRFVDPTGLVAVIGEHIETGEVVTELAKPTATATVYRDETSYDSKKGDYSSQGKDTMLLTVESELGVKSTHEVTGLQTVDIQTKAVMDQPVEGSNLQGNTIAPGSFNMLYSSTSGTIPGTVLPIANTKTIDGTVIGADGNAVSGGTNKSGRWLFHANAKSENPADGDWANKGSDGCFIPSSSEFNSAISFLQSRGVQNGTVIHGELKEYRNFWE